MDRCRCQSHERCASANVVQCLNRAVSGGASLNNGPLPAATGDGHRGKSIFGSRTAETLIRLVRLGEKLTRCGSMHARSVHQRVFTASTHPLRTWCRRHVDNALALLGGQGHDGEKGGGALEHVVPRHVLWRGAHGHLRVVHNQTHLRALAVMRWEDVCYKGITYTHRSLWRQSVPRHAHLAMPMSPHHACSMTGSRPAPPPPSPLLLPHL